MNKLKLYMLLTLLPLGLKPAAALTQEELLEQNIQEQEERLVSLFDEGTTALHNSYDALLSLIDGALTTKNPAVLTKTLKTINDSNEDFCFFVEQEHAYQQAKTVKQLQKIQGTIEHQIKFVSDQTIKADLKKLSKAINSAIQQFKTQEEDALLKESAQKTLPAKTKQTKKSQTVVSKTRTLNEQIETALQDYSDRKISMFSYYMLGVKRAALQAGIRGTFETNIYCPEHGFIGTQTLTTIDQNNNNKKIKCSIIKAFQLLKGHTCSFGQLENVPTLSFDLTTINNKKDFQTWLANTTDGIPTGTKEQVNVIIETFGFSEESKQLAKQILQTNNWACTYKDTKRALIELN